MEHIEELKLKIEKMVGDRATAEEIVSLVCQYENQEKESNKKKQKKGIEDARENGVMFGRPRIKEPSNFKEIMDSYLNGELSAAVAAKTCKMGVSTFYRRMSDYEREEKENEKSKKCE